MLRAPRSGRRRYRRSNTPYGTTSAEFDRLAPHRSMGTIGGGSGVLLGHLAELVVTNGRSDRKIGDSKLRGLFLAWLPKSKRLAIVRQVRKSTSPERLTPTDRSIFKRFHNGEARKAGLYDAPDRVGLRRIGYLRSLTYIVPKSIPSPQKVGYRWVHAFGDHGEHGHGEHRGTPSYPTSLMPWLCKDARGNFHIERRPGNKYNVTEWIYW